MLTLRPPRLDEEAEFLAGHAQMAAEGHVFGIGLRADMTWADYLAAVHGWTSGQDLPDGWVPNTFLVANVDGQIVGRTSIRHELNDLLARRGGHIGYGVLPAHRRKGYATEILRQSLAIVRSLGVDRVLVTCDDDNIGSARAIEACGGRLDSVLRGDDGASPLRHYWFDRAGHRN